jgi:methylglutaconyl-CoA hydratase
MSHGTVILQVEGEVALLTLNRPEKRNALSPELIADILEALYTVEHGPSRAAILTGAGQSFCAGMDLAALRKLADQTPAENLADARRTLGLFRRVWSFPNR